jgi:hypothetical protein
LLEFALDVVVAGFSGFIEVDLLCGDVDVSLGGDDVAACLSIVLTRLQGDVALGAADG